MSEAKDILPLLGIPSEKIKHYLCNEDGDNAYIYIELLDIRGYCPKCGSIKIGIKDYYKVHINNSLIKHKHYEVELTVRRYKCLSCGATFKQSYALTEPKQSISIAVKGQIFEDLKQPLTIKQISLDHNVSPTTVIKIFNSIPEIPALPLSEIICIDEFCYKHSKTKEGKYPCVITNPINGKIIDIIESRWKSYLIDYFNKVKVSERYNVKYFVSDMNETYRDIKRIFFKNAIHIADRFHVIKAFNEAITSIRTRIIKQEIYYDTKEAQYLKKNWKIFLKDRNDLKKIRQEDRYGIIIDLTKDLDKCLLKYPDLYYAYWLKEEFRSESKNLMFYKDAEQLINFYTNKMLNSRIDEITKIGKMFSNWKYEIINGITKNSFGFKISNAIAESRNNTIQTLIDICYGLPVFKNMRKRTLLINRNEKD